MCVLLAIGIAALFLTTGPIPTGTHSTTPAATSAQSEKSSPAKTTATPQVTASGTSCGSTQPTGTLPQLLPAICTSPTVLCNPGSCTTYPYSSKVHLWVNSTSNSTTYPWVQVVFVVETTVYDGVYDPTQQDYGDGTNGADPCTGPCAESVGVPYFVNNVAQIAQGITAKNVGVANSPHVTFSLVDHFSNYDPKNTGADSHDDDDGSEYNVDVSAFEPATTFASTVTTMATTNPSPLFGGGCSSSGWQYSKHFYCDSDFSDNFLQGSMITAIYGGLHGSGLGWVNNSTTYHVIVWMGSTLPRDPAYPGDWCATYNDAATACPNVAVSAEPAYTYASGVTEPVDETIAGLATIANQEHVIIDTIDLPNGMTEVTPPNPRVTGDTDYLHSTTAQKNAATEDVNSILGAGCALAKDTGGSWEGPTPASSGTGFTCSAAATGTSDGNLTDTWCAYTTGSAGVGCWPTWATDPSLGWALTNIKFPALTRQYNVTGLVGEHAFTWIPDLGFATEVTGETFSCRHNGTDISTKCANALNGSVGPGHGWDWPFTAMYPGDYWSVMFTATVSSFPSYLLNTTIPIDLCVNNSPQWGGCTGSGSGQYTYVAYTNYTGSNVVQSFPPAFVDVVTSSTSVPTLISVSVTPVVSDVLPNGTQSLTASPVCSWGTCPTGTTYTWTLTNSLGTLSGLTGSTVTFTAKSKLGNDTVFVNGTLYGITQQSLPATISIENLVSVSVTPPSAGILINATKGFSAVPNCTYGTCPSGATYYWNLTNYAMGTLYSATGASVTFIAINITGTVNLFANATLGSIKVISPAVPITISKTLPTLASVVISPSTASIAASSSGSFSTSVSCSGGTCPSGTTYTWNLTSTHYGSLNTTIQPTVRFTAGGVGGVVNLFVNATLNSKTVQSTAAVITILPPTLSSVTVSPVSLAVYAYGIANFTTVLGCKGGPCPVGTSYAWALTSTTLGALNSSSGPDVSFTANIVSGVVDLFLNATLAGITVEGGPAAITVNGLPTLTGVKVSPSSASLTAGGNKSFTASPVCSGGATCPAGTTFVWSHTNTIGTLNTYSGATVTLTANKAGTMALFANASLNGLNAQSAAVVVTIAGPLKSIAVSPTSASTLVQGVVDLKATVSCSGTCPSGTAYLWSLSNSALGKLNSTTNFMVAFTAGSTAGTLNLYVNATLDGATVHSAAVPITIATVQTVVSVTVSPSAQNLSYGDSTSFTATATCNPGACSSSLKYSWTMDNPLGTLSSNNSASVTFVAGYAAGITNLTVVAKLNGHTASNSALISITPTPTSTPPISFWKSSTVLMIAILAVAVVAVVVGVIMLGKKRKSEELAAEPAPSPYGFVMNSQTNRPPQAPPRKQ
jgi:hypothetical protein